MVPMNGGDEAIENAVPEAERVLMEQRREAMSRAMAVLSDPNVTQFALVAIDRRGGVHSVVHADPLFMAGASVWLAKRAGDKLG
jgi:hypothetical protein